MPNIANDTLNMSLENFTADGRLGRLEQEEASLTSKIIGLRAAVCNDAD